ncbi:active regulator of SIRT1 [Lepisosteus oculatus]|uniref:Active regulator of SIRT1 n=1 Tax=Lepisosteus oculatus TaxID=7918 RepID=W5MZ62_LEPOC|nr:PREDICTED: active regulator of SIRT1 [Lepisosteus oculatus]
MSASLIRRGLELLNDDLKGESSDGKRRSQKKADVAPGTSVMDRIRSDKQGVTRQVRRLRGRPGPGKSRATVKDKRIKSAVEEYLKKQSSSHLKRNLKYFLGKGFKAEESVTGKILSQHQGRQARDRPPSPAKKKEEKRSVFTEAEFEQFQKEYFGRLVEENV